MKRLGDGMMAVFKSADGALAALAEGRERLGEVDADGYEPQIRAGLHVGSPRKVGKDYFGVDVNIAARVADGAGPGELLLSDAALEAIGSDGIKVKSRPLLDAKGVPEDFRVYAVSRPQVSPAATSSCGSATSSRSRWPRSSCAPAAPRAPEASTRT